MPMGGFAIHKRVIFFIMAGAIVFYLPHISKYFIGDDWLWLANAKSAAGDPSIFVGRPMYGYFRPLNMVLVFIMLNLFGPRPWAFSLVNILLHACNIWLLWVLLGRFRLPDSVRNLSAFIFAFYYLNAAAVERISVGHDLWVTGLSLLFAIITLELIEKPAIPRFLLLLAVGLMAVLIKESGFVTLGIYFILLILKGKSPIYRKYIIYSAIIVLIYLLYLFGYYITRTFADGDLDIGIGTAINLWYFIAYLAAPISKRIAEGFPVQYIWILSSIRIITSVSVPVLLIYIFVKAGTGCRFFILWSAMFISTITIFKWDIGLFSLYPAKTASRFMYSPFPGLAVAVAWFITTKISWAAAKNVYFKSTLIIFYIAANFLIVHRISQLYINQQALTASIQEDFGKMESVLERGDTLIVLTGDMANTPTIISSGELLRDIIYVTMNYEIEVILEQRKDYQTADSKEENGIITACWDNRNRRFIIPPVIDVSPNKNPIDLRYPDVK